MPHAEDAVRAQIDQVRAFLDEGTPEGVEDVAAEIAARQFDVEEILEEL